MFVFLFCFVCLFVCLVFLLRYRTSLKKNKVCELPLEERGNSSQVKLTGNTCNTYDNILDQQPGGSKES